MKNFTQNISYWAKRNPWKSRLFIIIGKTILNILAVIVGICLYLEGFKIAGLFFPIALIIYTIGFIFYPKNKATLKETYFRQKACDFLLLNSIFIGFMALGNFGANYINSNEQTPSVSPTLIAYKKEAPKKDRQLKKTWKKNLRKEVKELVQTFKQIKNEKTSGDNVALIVLSVLVFFIVEYLLLALACSIACSGSEGMAVFVFLLGTGLAITGLVSIIKKILGKDKKSLEKNRRVLD